MHDRRDIHVEILRHDGDVTCSEWIAVCVQSGHGECELSHIDTRQIDGTTWEPCAGVLRERVAVHGPARSTVEVQSRLDLAPVKGTAGAFTWCTIEFDGGGEDGVITTAGCTLEVEVVLGVDVALFLYNPEESGNRVVEHDVGGQLVGSLRLRVEVGDLDVLDEVLVCIRLSIIPRPGLSTGGGLYLKGSQDRYVLTPIPVQSLKGRHMSIAGHLAGLTADCPIPCIVTRGKWCYH